MYSEDTHSEAAQGAAPKKRAVRPNLGGKLRPRAKSPRRNFFYIEVTDGERKAIYDYCSEKNMSVSQFLAELLLEEAKKPRPKEKVVLRPALELTYDEHEKLELLAKLHSKESVDELIRELIQPSLEMQKLHTDSETTALRFYLSQEEHAVVSEYISEKGVPARKYATMIALKAIAKDGKRRKSHH